MNRPTTTHVGPLGSTFHVLHADAGTITALATVDWSRCFRRVCLDPVRGLITLMAPSHRHEDLTWIFDDLVETAGVALAGAARKLRSPRLRGQGEPPGTGVEPDCAFYVGDRARGCFAAQAEGEDALDAYLEHTPPDLVVEVEITHANAGKAERYAQMGVRELWRLHGRKGRKEIRAELLALRAGRPPERLDASKVLEGLTPEDINEAVGEMWAGRPPIERMRAVERIVQRRRDGSVRVREEAAVYSAGQAAPEGTPGARAASA